jgi:prevent-host-death family protein
VRTYTTKEASRRLSAVLKDAQVSPVVIERHGRGRAAVMSIRRFELCEKLLRNAMDEMAVDALHDSLEAAKDGKLRTAAQLRLMARSMAGLGK